MLNICCGPSLKFPLIAWGESSDRLWSLKMQSSEKRTIYISLEREFKMEQKIHGGPKKTRSHKLNLL